ncbi:MAG TPA: hypothetical protein VGB85_16385, partial [Nannocystis sp.]
MKDLSKWTCPIGLVVAFAASPAAALPRSDLPRAEDMWQGLRGEPGSGAAREPGSGDPARLTTPPSRQAQNPEDAAALAAMETITARYRNAARISAHT